ncbi:hypothetical protein QBC42DRAFT_327152 [Cladorrhinum samala]|uniref:Protein kinase domain-containing protein n=1 Tax=Cladorrhinum samala TaxID=585594 RepID=A0AAV9HNP3_9PEZI|nr:hypothetical protein QBC42DRAFT_327152 [Cladorrhinum samala]
MADVLVALYDQLDNPNNPHRYARWIPQPNINLPADRNALQVHMYPPARQPGNANAAPRRRGRSAGIAGALIHSFAETRRDEQRPINNSNCEFRYLKTLGCGGQGLAALYEYTPNLDRRGEVRHVVIKYFFPHERRIARVGRAQAVARAREIARKEVFFAAGFLRAAHVTQLARIQQLPPRAMLFFNLPDGCATALEYYARGDAHGALKRFSQYYWSTLNNAQRISLPKKFYWNIFKCLWRMHVAMAYPPRSFAGDQDAFCASTELINEEFPGFFDPGARRQPSRLVHFDLDPQNILVGDFDDDRGSDHYSVPNLKVSDFGCMQDVTRAKLRDAACMQRFRAIGKTAYLAPEQFTTEWDLPFFDPRAPPQDWPAEVAGKFSNKTNLFQLGMVMYNFLTLTMMGTSDPRPQPIPYPHHPHHPVEAGKPPGRTYASVLLYDDQAGHIEPYLRDLVIRMLYEDADRRPDFMEVESILRITQPWARGDDESRDLSERIFNQPSQAVPDGPKSRLLNYLEHGGALQPGMGPTEMIPWYDQNFPAQGNAVPAAAPGPAAQPGPAAPPGYGAVGVMAPPGGPQLPYPPIPGGPPPVFRAPTPLHNAPPPPALGLPPPAGLAPPAGFAHPGMQAAQAAQAAGAGQGVGAQLAQHWNQQALAAAALLRLAGGPQSPGGMRGQRGQTPGPGVGRGRGASGAAQVLAPYHAGLQNRYPRRTPLPGVAHLISQVGGYPGPAAQHAAGRGRGPAPPQPPLPGIASIVMGPPPNMAAHAAQQAAMQASQQAAIHAAQLAALQAARQPTPGVHGPGIIGPAAMAAPGGPAAPQGPALPHIPMGPPGPVLPQMQMQMGPPGPAPQHLLRSQPAQDNLRGQAPGSHAGNAGGAGEGGSGGGGAGGGGSGGGGSGGGGAGGGGSGGGGSGGGGAGAAKATILNVRSDSSTRRRRRARKSKVRHLARMARRTTGPYAWVSDVDENGEEIPIPPNRAAPFPPKSYSPQAQPVHLPSPPQTVPKRVRFARLPSPYQSSSRQAPPERLPSPTPVPPPREFVTLFPTDTSTRLPPRAPQPNKPAHALPTPLTSILTSSQRYYPPSSSRSHHIVPSSSRTHYTVPSSSRTHDTVPSSSRFRGPRQQQQTQQPQPQQQQPRQQQPYIPYWRPYSPPPVAYQTGPSLLGPRPQPPSVPPAQRQSSPFPWFREAPPSPRAVPSGPRDAPPSVRPPFIRDQPRHQNPNPNPNPSPSPSPSPSPKRNPNPSPSRNPNPNPSRPRPAGPRSPPPLYPPTPPLPPQYSPTRLPHYSDAPQAGHNLPPAYPNREEIIAQLQHQDAERGRRQMQRARADQERARRVAELEGARAREARAALRRRLRREREHGGGLGRRLRRLVLGYRDEDEEEEEEDA